MNFSTLPIAVRGRVVEEDDVAGVLVAGQAVGEEGEDVGAGEGGVGVGDDAGDGDFAPGGVGAADDGGFGDVGAVGEDGFELGGIDVLAARDHDVLLAVVDVVEAVGVLVADVAGAQPAVGEGVGGRLGIAPVAGHQIGAAEPDLARLALGHVAALGVDDARLAVGGRLAAGADLARGVRDRQRDGDRAALGHSVDLGDGDAAVHPRADHRLGDGGRAGAHGAQAREIGGGEAGVPAERLGDGGDGEEQRGPARLQEVERLVGIEAARQRDRRAREDGRRGLDIEAADVEHRQHRQDVIRARHVVGGDRVERVPQERALGQHGAFRPPGRSRRVDDEERRCEVTAPAERRRGGRGQLLVTVPAIARGRRPAGHQVRHPAAHLLRVGIEVRLGEEGARLRVAEDEAMLGRGEPPVQGDEDGAEAGAGEEQLEDHGRVVAEIGDAVARPDLEGRRRARRRVGTPADRARHT